MIMCKLFGHKWIKLVTGKESRLHHSKCQRCGFTKYPKQKKFAHFLRKIANMIEG